MSIEEQQCSNCQRVFLSELDYLKETQRWRLCSEGNLWFNCRCHSTLMLKRGRFPWYSPNLALSDEGKSVFNRLSNLKDLPRLPSVIMELQQTLDKSSVTPKDIAAALKHEPFVAAQVLRIAENLRLARNPINPPIKSIEHAVVYIGCKALRDVLYTAGLSSMQTPPSAFDQAEFWRESFLTGTIAEFLAKKIGLPLASDEVFIAGSLCNVGKLVAAISFPPLVTKIVRDVHNPKILATWRQAEATCHFPDHTILGEIGACLWGLPEYVMVIAKHHHNIPGDRRWPHPDMAAVTTAANQFMHAVMLEPHRIEPEVMLGFQLYAKLDNAAMAALDKEVHAISQKARAAL